MNWALSDEYHDVPGGHVRIYRHRELMARLERTGLTVMGSHHAHGLHAPYWWLRCLVGPANDDHPAVAAYHRLLVWDIVKAPRTTRYTERVLNPLVGKSLVVYLMKPAVTGPAVTGSTRIGSAVISPAVTGSAASGRTRAHSSVVAGGSASQPNESSLARTGAPS